MNEISELPDQSRVWVFGADRALTPQEQEALRGNLRSFIETWAAHKVKLAATADVLHDRFVIVALDESSSASGCSIDALFRHMGQLEKTFGLRLLDSSLLFYGRAGEIRSTDRTGFRKLASEGAIDRTTPVYDTTLETLGALRQEFTRPASGSWHSQLLP